MAIEHVASSVPRTHRASTTRRTGGGGRLGIFCASGVGERTAPCALTNTKTLIAVVLKDYLSTSFGVSLPTTERPAFIAAAEQPESTTYIRCRRAAHMRR